VPPVRAVSLPLLAAQAVARIDRLRLAQALAERAWAQALERLQVVLRAAVSVAAMLPVEAQTAKQVPPLAAVEMRARLLAQERASALRERSVAVRLLRPRLSVPSLALLAVRWDRKNYRASAATSA